MWKLCLDSLWGYLEDENFSGGEYVWRTDVTDAELENMPRFLKRHLRGHIDQYAVAFEGEGHIVIRQAQSGNPIMMLYRIGG